MHETLADLERLQELLDASFASAGAHLASIFTLERRLDAHELAALLPGVQVLNLATVTSASRPLVAPVDGLFYRGHFYFGSSPDSLRARHIRARPAVSAAHTRGEELAVIAHGAARVLDLDAAEHAGFRRYLLDTYVPVYGPGWEENVASGAWYARIEPAKLFTFAWADPH